MKKSNKKRFFIVSFLLLSTTCVVSQTAAQVISSLGRTVTIRIDSTGSDSAWFAYPPALGYSSVRPDTNSINPPDAVWFDGNETIRIKQLTGDLADSIKVYRKSLDSDGTIIFNDSAFALGAASTWFTATGAVGQYYGKNVQNTTAPRLFGSLIIFQVGDIDTSIVSLNRTFQLQHTTSGIYDIRQR